MTDGKSELTCLHTNRDGTVWKVGVDGNPRPVTRLGDPWSLPAGSYRVLGCPVNYQLIAELYMKLVYGREGSRVLVGSPNVCAHRYGDIERLLLCLSAPSVHDSLVHRWHVADKYICNNLLLLYYYHQEGMCDVVTRTYGYHCLSRHFDFISLESVELAVKLISEIVDPRWFLKAEKPYRLSRLEHHFGLNYHQPRISKSLDCDSQRRLSLLRSIVDELPHDSVIVSEKTYIGDARLRMTETCRKVLSFVARVWLSELSLDGYFDPQRFFKRTLNLDAYRLHFKEPT